eukprot:2532080-Amphidinium_carterae.1
MTTTESTRTLEPLRASLKQRVKLHCHDDCALRVHYGRLTQHDCATLAQDWKTVRSVGWLYFFSSFSERFIIYASSK